ncbi:MAG TPA: FAD binding domain-containing protein [Desulfomonilaceae bacterium]|nr:FAD binding domain-containing protein [Desulfomonilaceae bacterium]
MRTFEYLKPTSVREAVDTLGQFGDRAKVIAGRTDLMIQWKKRLVSPECLISVRNIAEMDFIMLNNDLRIGSATTRRTTKSIRPRLR